MPKPLRLEDQSFEDDPDANSNHIKMAQDMPIPTTSCQAQPSGKKDLCGKRLLAYILLTVSCACLTSVLERRSKAAPRLENELHLSADIHPTDCQVV